MKLIHCADFHLDSPMSANLPPEKARERRTEILNSFAKIVRIADEGEVAAILIAGDLFDSNRVTKKTEKYVLDIIKAYPNLFFFYLSGNHDDDSFLHHLEDKPDNLCLFDRSWRSYEFGEVTITGSEAPNEDALQLRADRLNIVMMHGQEAVGGHHSNLFTLSKLKNRNIDYLALGHIHRYHEVALDSRCTACYCGCPEGRGFDECGPKGYVLLETDGRGIQHRFVPMSRRQLHTVSCDVTEITSQLTLENKMLEAVEHIPQSHLVKLVLTGETTEDFQMDTVHLTQLLSERFYFAKVDDETRLLLNPEDYLHSVSLKGEFVRRVYAQKNLSEEEKQRIIACGFSALRGEEMKG